MLIDSHTHIGNIPFEVGKNRVKYLPGEDLLASLEKYKIDFAIVSGIEGAEFDADGKLVPKRMQISQKEGLERIIGFVRNNKTRVRGLFWIKPYTEQLTEEIENILSANLELLCGLKVHPKLSNLKFTDRKYYPYLEMAVRLGLPVQVHTENDGNADVKFVGKIASVFPELKFVMVHMGLNSDNKEAMSLIMDSENIYGDTTGVKHENVIEAIKKCGPERVLFGSDAIVSGIDSHEKYVPLIKKIKETFSENDAAKVLGLNSKMIFNLPVSM